MRDSLTARTVRVPGYGGAEIEAYFAVPIEGPPQRGGVVVIHHLPGYDRTTKEITRRIAELGYNAIMPNLYCHDVPGAGPAEAAAAAAKMGGIDDYEVMGDVAGSVEYLQSLPSSNGRVGTIGYCSGGRQSVLAGCTMPLDAVVDCYGGAVIRPPGEQIRVMRKSMTSLVSKLPDLRAPLLGLFGNDDQFPSPDEVDEFESILAKHGKEYEIHRFDGAGHAFFASDRDGFRPVVAEAGWERVADFFERNLQTVEVDPAEP